LSLHVVELYPDQTTPSPTTTIPTRQQHRGLYNVSFGFTFFFVKYTSPKQQHQGLYNVFFGFTFSLLSIRRLSSNIEVCTMYSLVLLFLC